MANTIRLKRGLSSNVTSASLIEGELALTTDTLELYTNNGTENVKLTQKGESGVYVGTSAPTDDSVIWIDPNGEGKSLAEIYKYDATECNIGDIASDFIGTSTDNPGTRIYATTAALHTTGEADINLSENELKFIYIRGGSYVSGVLFYDAQVYCRQGFYQVNTLSSGLDSVTAWEYATKTYVDENGGGGNATALSGTSAPTDDIGNVGDIYILYN